jgi:hypothetical protein
VWLAAAAIGALAAVAIAVSVLVPRDFYTGTNSIRTRSFPAELGPGQVLCTAEQRIPAGTGRIELEVNTGPRPPLSMELRLRGQPVVRSPRPLQGPTVGRAKIDFPIPRRPDSPDFTPGTICVRSGGDHVFFGGEGGLQLNDRPATAVGRPLAARIAVWFRPPVGERRSVASLAGKILLRASLFRPGFVGRWTYVAILALMMPALMYAGVRLMATAGGGQVTRRLGLAGSVALLAFLNAAAWSLITPAFDAPDEPDHFAYGQYLAETGRAPSNVPRPAYSADERRALDELRTLTSNERGDGKPPWLPDVEREWRGRGAGGGDGPLARDDAGRQATSTALHSPLYYSLLVPSYEAVGGASIFSELWAMRMMSALLGAIVAACAVAIARELLPRRPLLAAAAGLLVAFQPMFGFMSGVVNNDMGVNAAAAVLVYLLVRGLMRGLTVRLALATGAMLVVTPLMKGTGFALYPAAIVGLGAMLWRLRDRLAWLRPGAAVAVTAGAAFATWSAVSSSFHRSTVTTPGGGAPGSDAPGLDQPLDLAAYLWQVFLPKLSFMTEFWPSYSWPFFDLWIVRGFAAFGWYAMTFPDWVYWAIAAVAVGIAALFLATLVRRRDAVRRLLLPLIVLALVIAGVIGGVHAYYFPDDGPRIGYIPEQGRYAFPAITALATLTVGSLLALPRRFVAYAAAGLATAMMTLDYAAQLLALTRFYS